MADKDKQTNPSVNPDNNDDANQVNNIPAEADAEEDDDHTVFVDAQDQDPDSVLPTLGETIKVKADHSKTLELKTVEDVMEYSYLRYSMSVIIDRALPAVRDGMKPVHRRILYTMERNGWRPGTKFVKSARIVGDVMGKYHPHGDSAIYDAMVRLAQDWVMRYPLVEGQGNFGSMDGDPPAANRYTEARMGKAGAALLMDLDKDTVDFRDNYDGTLKEPVVLPAKLPNLLLNGQMGIAVGMATNIPTPNLIMAQKTLLSMIC